MTEYTEHGFREATGMPSYASQRQLDFRLERVGTLRVVSLWDERASPDDERDFRIAINRRNEPEGASLDQIGKKYRL